MALDTTIGGSSSDSYVDLGYADAYHASMGNSSWTGSNVEKEAALRRAAVWLDGSYQRFWSGTPVNGRNQARAWPQIGGVDYFGNEIDSSSIPEEIKRAQSEIALAELQSPGSLTPSITPGQTIKSEKIGSIAVEYQGGQDVASFIPVLTRVDVLLQGIIFNRDLEYPAVVVV